MDLVYDSIPPLGLSFWSPINLLKEVYNGA